MSSVVCLGGLKSETRSLCVFDGSICRSEIVTGCHSIRIRPLTVVVFEHVFVIVQPRGIKSFSTIVPPTPRTK